MAVRPFLVPRRMGSSRSFDTAVRPCLAVSNLGQCHVMTSILGSYTDLIALVHIPVHKFLCYMTSIHLIELIDTDFNYIHDC
jgi:hypothetical protein